MKRKEFDRIIGGLEVGDPISVTYVAVTNLYREKGGFLSVTKDGYLRIRVSEPVQTASYRYSGISSHHYSKIKTIKKVEEE